MPAWPARAPLILQRPTSPLVRDHANSIYRPRTVTIVTLQATHGAGSWTGLWSAGLVLDPQSLALDWRLGPGSMSVLQEGSVLGPRSGSVPAEGSVLPARGLGPRFSVRVGPGRRAVWSLVLGTSLHSLPLRPVAQSELHPPASARTSGARRAAPSAAPVSAPPPPRPPPPLQAPRRTSPRRRRSGPP